MTKKMNKWSLRQSRKKALGNKYDCHSSIIRSEILYTDDQNHVTKLLTHTKFTQ